MRKTLGPRQRFAARSSITLMKQALTLHFTTACFVHAFISAAARLFHPGQEETPRVIINSPEQSPCRGDHQPTY